MDRAVWERVGPNGVAGVVVAAVLLFAVIVLAGATLEAAALAAAAALAVAAGLALSGWRRSVARAAGAQAAAGEAHDQVQRAAADRARTHEELARLRHHSAREADEHRREREALERERDGLRQRGEALERERDHLRQHGEALERERDDLRERADALEAEWHGLRKQAEALERERDGTRQQRDELERDREAVRREVDRLKGALARERRLLERLQQSWRAEREWNRELRGQVQRLYEGRERSGEDGDVNALILRAAIELVEAEKGMLLSRRDTDGDGELDVVVSHGFEHDPRHSAVAQRFGREVLDRDEIVREDEPGGREDEAATPADREIDSLVATPLYLQDRFSGVVICANRSGGFEEVDNEILLALGDHAGAALHHGQLRHELRDAHRASVRVLLEAVAARDPALHRESAQLAVRAITLARDMGLDDRLRDVLVTATLLRTVGYLALPDGVLLKPGPLSPDERAVVELHSRIGFNIIGQVPALRDVAATVLYHHERFDGGGYPAGLVGREVPIASRALAVLEAYSAMTHHRSYRAPRSPEEACAELVDAAGTQFDPEITQLLVEEIRRSPTPPDEDLADAVLEALPLSPAGDADDVLGPLAASATDGLTLLGNHRAMQEGVRAAARDATAQSPFAVVLVQLEDLPRINERDSLIAGDRLIQVAARNMQRAAARLGGSAYRASGRRLAVVAPIRDGRTAGDVLDQVQTEFAAGPSVRTGLSVWEPGERGDEVIGRARRALEAPDAAPSDGR